MKTLRGNTNAGGPFEALAAPRIAANTAWFASGLPLYINPNDAMQTRTVTNLYGRVTER